MEQTTKKPQIKKVIHACNSFFFEMPDGDIAEIIAPNELMATTVFCEMFNTQTPRSYIALEPKKPFVRYTENLSDIEKEFIEEAKQRTSEILDDK